MYNAERLTQWKTETEELLQKIVDERRPLLQEIVNQEVPSKFKIFEHNGSVSLHNKKLETVSPEEAEKFINELANMQYQYLELTVAPVVSNKRKPK